MVAATVANIDCRPSADAFTSYATLLRHYAAHARLFAMRFAGASR
jgi:hypothetical protein